MSGMDSMYRYVPSIALPSATIVIRRARRPIRPALISSVCSMKRLGVFVLPLDGILSGCPQTICWFPFIHLGEERHCESLVFA